LTDSEYSRSLGQTGFKVFPIGLGTVKFGRNTDVKYPRSFSLPDDKSLDRLLAVARDSGINLLDTAPAYGDSELRLGRLIQSSRDHWCLCTKVGEYYRDGRSHYDFSARSIRASVASSLKNLKTEVLDLVLIHSNGDDEAIIGQTDALQTLQELKDAGSIRSFGMSTKTVSGGLQALQLVDVVMVTLNPQDLSQADLIVEARRHGKGILIKKALASGHANSVEQALIFALEYPGVSSVIVGTINPDHLLENVACVGHGARGL